MSNLLIIESPLKMWRKLCAVWRDTKEFMDNNLNEITLENATSEQLEAEVIKRIDAGMMIGTVSHDKGDHEIIKIADHEHTWISGRGQGGVALRICTVTGCGLTEKV